MHHFNSTQMPVNMNLYTLFASMTMRDRMALTSLVNSGKVRLITRMGIGSWDHSYIPTNGERNVKFNLTKQLRNLGFSLFGKAPVTQFILTFMASLGYQTSIEQITSLVIKSGYKPITIMPVINIIKDILGIQLSTRKIDTVTQTMRQSQVKGKGTVNKRIKSAKKQGKVQYLDPSIATVRSSLTKWVNSSSTGILKQANVVGFTIYVVDAAVDIHDKAFGTRAYFSVDVITLGDHFVVVNTRTNEVISQRTPFVTEVFLHDVQTPFTQNLINLVSQGFASTQTFGIDAEKMVTCAFAKGTTYLSNLWLNRILTANEAVNEKIKATKLAVEDILTSGKIDEQARKQLSHAASSVFDSNRGSVSEQDLQLVGANIGQQSPFSASLPSNGWNAQMNQGIHGQQYGH